MKGSGSESPRLPFPARIAASLPAARRGDRRARERLLECCEPLLESRVRRRLPPGKGSTDADDLLQTIRLAIVEKLHFLRSDDPGSFLSWVEKLVRSRIIDWERARGRRPEVAAGLGGEGCPEPAAPTLTPSRILMGEEERARVARAIGSVPERYRSVLRLIVREDPGPGKVAAFLGKEPEAARKFIERALAHLGRILRASTGPGTRRIGTRFTPG